MLAHPVALGAGAFWLSACRAAGGQEPELAASLVLCGRRSAVIGTGRVEDQSEWVDAVCSLVDADDLGWIVLTSDEADHAGGLPAAMAAFPSAVVAAPWAAPRSEVRWREVGDGDEIDLDGARLRFLAPTAVGGRPAIAVHVPERALLWVPGQHPCGPVGLASPLETLEPVHLLLGPRSRPVARPRLAPVARS